MAKASEIVSGGTDGGRSAQLEGSKTGMVGRKVARAREEMERAQSLPCRQQEAGRVQRLCTQFSFGEGSL